MVAHFLLLPALIQLFRQSFVLSPGFHQTGRVQNLQEVQLPSQGVQLQTQKIRDGLVFCFCFSIPGSRLSPVRRCCR